MKPIILSEKPLIRAYNCDCMKVMDGGRWDLAMIDPPYNVGASNGSFGRGGKRAKNTRYRTELKHYANHDVCPDKSFFDELFRVSTNQIIWGANYYPQYLYHSGWIVWDKDKKDGLLSQAELAFQSINKVVKIFKHEWEGFRKGPGSFETHDKKTIHPNQKPNALYVWSLLNYAKPGQTILDTHGGSFSSAIACWKMGYDLDICELDEDYFKEACERFERETRQQNLF